MTAEEKKTLEMIRQIREAVEGFSLSLEEFPLKDLENLLKATIGREFVGVTGGMDREAFFPLSDGFVNMLQHCIDSGDVTGCVKTMVLLEEQYICLDAMLRAYRDQRYVEPYKKVTAGAGEAYSEMQHYMRECVRKQEISTDNLGEKGRGVVYTCTFFCRHEIQQPEYINLQWDYICFTNVKEKIGTKEGAWEYREMPVGNLDNMEELYHLCTIKPHLLFPEYDYSIWVSPNYKITGNLELFMASFGRHVSFLAFPSYVTDDVYDIMYTGLRGDDENISVRKKRLQYEKEGYPQHNCMISDRIIIRSHGDEKMRMVMDSWWKEALECGRMWEYGFNYAAWKHDFDYALCDLFLEMNPYFKSMLIDLEVRAFE